MKRFNPLFVHILKRKKITNLISEISYTNYTKRVHWKSKFIGNHHIPWIPQSINKQKKNTNANNLRFILGDS